MKKKLTPGQKDALDTLKASRFKYLEVGPGLLQPRTADSLVRKGYCVYDSIGWADGPHYRVIRLAEESDATPEEV